MPATPTSPPRRLYRTANPLSDAHPSTSPTTPRPSHPLARPIAALSAGPCPVPKPVHPPLSPHALKRLSLRSLCVCVLRCANPARWITTYSAPTPIISLSLSPSSSLSPVSSLPLRSTASSVLCASCSLNERSPLRLYPISSDPIPVFRDISWPSRIEERGQSLQSLFFSLSFVLVLSFSRFLSSLSSPWRRVKSLAAEILSLYFFTHAGENILGNGFPLWSDHAYHRGRCVRFIDYFDCHAGDSAVRAFITREFLPRISFRDAPFAIRTKVFRPFINPMRNNFLPFFSPSPPPFFSFFFLVSLPSETLNAVKG